MEAREEVARVRWLSDEELLAGLRGVLGSSRTLAALLVAHLGEVEERRLHLLAGFGSLFAYCTDRLGMSEDEAYRRIEIARLARCFPRLLELIAAGRLSLSVAALLKGPEVNHVALLDAVAGTTVKRAREVLAAWFPRPDVLPSIRKLPVPRAGSCGSARSRADARPLKSVDGDGFEKGVTPASARGPASCCRGAAGASAPPAEAVGLQPGCRIAAESSAAEEAADRAFAYHGANTTDARSAAEPRRADRLLRYDTGVVDDAGCNDVGVPASESTLAEKMPTARLVLGVHPAPWFDAPARSRAKRAPTTIEPLSPERYKIAFTADGDLERKLDLARDLLRHAVPEGDIATIIGKAIDLLLEKTLQRRFAKTTRRTSRSASAAARATWASGSSPVKRGSAPQTMSTIEPASECVALDVAWAAEGGRDAGAAATANEATSNGISERTTGTSAGASRIGKTPSMTLPNDCARVASRRSASVHDTNAAPIQSAVTPLDPAQARAAIEPPATSTPLAALASAATLATPADSRRVPSHVRRAVLERDGLRCTWVGPDGVRCESCAWLELDHIVPWGLGGGNEPANIRIRCRAHNRLAAEQAYGQPAIARIIAQRRAGGDPSTLPTCMEMCPDT